MKLEVGMYVRTNKGLIAKYIGYEKDEEDIGYSEYRFDGKIYWYYEYYNDCVYEEDFQEWFKEKVVKVSHDITDLIDDNDFIEYRRYGELVSSRVYNLPCFGEYKMFVNCNGEVLDLEDLEIVSILTKEQFESMSYKVGEFNDD